jgi:2-keto-3-deoxy-L-fuconate dehydrogenase
MSGRLEGKRVLVTSADRYLGPPIVELFSGEGAEVTADTSDYTKPGEVERVVTHTGRIDVLALVLAGPLRLMPFTNMLGPCENFKDEDFQSYLDELVWPMLRFVRAVLPQMKERREGKIVAVTSASSVRAIPGLAVYSACRGAQNTFIKVVGKEAAEFNVQINSIGPAFVENVSYFTPQMLSDPDTRAGLIADIPARVIGSGKDGAELALALATDASNFLAGQTISLSGGWSD